MTLLQGPARAAEAEAGLPPDDVSDNLRPDSSVRSVKPVGLLWIVVVFSACSAFTTGLSSETIPIVRLGRATCQTATLCGEGGGEMPVKI